MPRKPRDVTLEGYTAAACNAADATRTILSLSAAVLKLQDKAYIRLEARMTVLERRLGAHLAGE